MISLRNINQYKFTVSSPDILDRSNQSSEYVKVLVTKVEDNTGAEIYVNLMKSEIFNKIFNIDKNFRPSPSTDMKEYNYYLDNKDQQMPMWLLSKNSLNMLFDLAKG